MVFHAKSRITKRTKEDITPIVSPSPSPSQPQPCPIANPATSSSRAAPLPTAPPSKPNLSTPIPTRNPVEESSLSPTPNGSLGKKARRRQEQLVKTAIAASSRRDVSINLLKGTGPVEIVGDSESLRQSPKQPQPKTDRLSPSPTKPHPTERSLGKKPKRRYERLDLQDETTDAIERRNLLKKTRKDDEPLETTDGASESALDSPKSPEYQADPRSPSSTPLHREKKLTSKKSRRH